MDPQALLPALKQFFAGYRSVAGQVDPQEQAGRYDTFFRGLSVQLRRVRELEAGAAPGFNIFSIIRMEAYEALTHTPVLAHLLDPRGSHAQGDLFYTAFLDHLPTERKEQFRTSRLFVAPEHWTNDGFIDIFIRSQDPQKPFCIVLENKIDAGDQPRQLSRYFEYAARQLGYPEDQILLLYLTKAGYLPSPASMPTEEQERLRGKDCLHAVSYRGFVSAFLKAAVPHIQAPSVRHTVQQYLHLISSF